jgi:hypothetical protein
MGNSFGHGSRNALSTDIVNLDEPQQKAWYDPQHVDQFFETPTSFEVSDDGVWETRIAKITKTAHAVMGLFAALFSFAFIAMVCAIIIRRDTAHDFDVDATSTCTITVDGVQVKAPARIQLLFSTSAKAALSNDNTMLDVAMAFLIISTVIFFVSGIFVFIPKMRYRLRDHKTLQTKIWYVCVLIGGTASMIAAAFCMPWAASGFVGSFDSSITCNGQNLFTVSLQAELDDHIKLLAAVAAFFSIGALGVLTLLTYLLLAKDFSVSFAVLHWIQMPYRIQSITTHAGLQSYAPSPAEYEAAIAEFFPLETNRDIKYPDFFGKMNVNGPTFVEVRILELDPSPALINAMRNNLMKSQQMITPAQANSQIRPQIGIFRGIIDAIEKQLKDPTTSQNLLKLDHPLKQLSDAVDLYEKAATQRSVAPVPLQLKNRAPLTLAAVDTLFLPRTHHTVV